MAITGHTVAIVEGGPTGLILAGELALAGVDVGIIERRESQDLVGSHAGGLHSRTIEALDQREIDDLSSTVLFLAQSCQFWRNVNPQLQPCDALARAPMA